MLHAELMLADAACMTDAHHACETAAEALRLLAHCEGYGSARYDAIMLDASLMAYKAERSAPGAMRHVTMMLDRRSN